MRIASAVKRLVVGTVMLFYLVGTEEGQNVYRLEIILIVDLEDFYFIFLHGTLFDLGG